MSKPPQPPALRAAHPRRAGSDTVVARMVAELLAGTDPGGRTDLRERFRAEYQPSNSHEEFLVDRLAEVCWRSQGCLALETEILTRGMQASQGGEHAPDALLQAFRQDFHGPDLLARLSAYEERLLAEQRLCIRRLERLRIRRPPRIPAEELFRLKSCTDVVQ